MPDRLEQFVPDSGTDVRQVVDVLFRFFKGYVALQNGFEEGVYVFVQFAELLTESPGNLLLQIAGVNSPGAGVHVFDIEYHGIRLELLQQYEPVGDDAAAPGPGSHLGNGQIVDVEQKQ